jgi:heme oxygenase
LQVEGLLRSERLRADIRTLSGIPDQDVEEELQAISQNGKVSNFIAHTTRSVNANPHVLLAYAWVLYMALFAGGRHLRASLQNAGSNFWEISRGVFPLQQSKDRTTPSPIEGGKRESEGLAFFHFPGEEDGEDIKRNFKRCFTEAEALLSDREKDDIVCEAQHIFAFLVELIGELDQKQLLRRQDAPPKDQSVGVSGALSRAGIPAVNINVKLGQCLALSSLLAFLVWCSIGR